MLIIGIILIAVALLLGYFSRKNKQSHNDLQTRVAVPLGQASTGSQVEVNAVAAGDVVESPVSKRPCVWWSYSATEYYPEKRYDSSTESYTWEEASRSRGSQSSASELIIADPANPNQTVTVAINDARQDRLTRHKQLDRSSSSFGSNDFGSNIGGVGVSIGGGYDDRGYGAGSYNGRLGVEYDECMITAGDSLYVTGYLANNHISKQDAPFIVSTRTEAEFEKALSTKSNIQSIATIILLIVGLGLIVAQLAG